MESGTTGGQPTPTNGSQRSIAGLVSDLAQNTGDLVRKEVELAKVEMTGKITEVKKGVASMAAGAAVLFAGVIVLLFALVIGLSYFMAPWIAALLVGVVAAAVGSFAVQRGRRDVQPDHLKPERTAESLRTTSSYIKEQLR